MWKDPELRTADLNDRTVVVRTESSVLETYLRVLSEDIKLVIEAFEKGNTDKANDILSKYPMKKTLDPNWKIPRY